MSDDTKVKVVGLTKKFGDLLVLNDISFNVKKGDFVCIVGPTGCGKTTFLNLLVKLIEPTSGQILIDGEPADPKKHNISSSEASFISTTISLIRFSQMFSSFLITFPTIIGLLVAPTIPLFKPYSSSSSPQESIQISVCGNSTAA